MKAYSRETVEIVLEKYNCFEAVRDLVEITDEGIKLSKEGRGFDELAWTPGFEVVSEAFTDNLSLPFPCSSEQFGAFLIHGPGVAVAGAFGDFCTGPAPDMLDCFGYTESSARELLESAYQKVRSATAQVGEPCGHLTSETAAKNWCREMVVRLLSPHSVDIEKVLAETITVKITGAHVSAAKTEPLEGGNESDVNEKSHPGCIQSGSSRVGSSSASFQQSKSEKPSDWCDAMVEELISRGSPSTDTAPSVFNQHGGPNEVLELHKAKSVKLVAERSASSPIVRMECDYFCRLMMGSKWKSAKDLYGLAFQNAGHPDSPFEHALGRLKGVLVHKKTNKILGERTFGNNLAFLKSKLDICFSQL